jgi:hypothetical protein
LIYDFLLFVHNGLDLPDRQIELLGKWLVANPIQKPALQYPAISLTENPLVDEVLHFRSGDVHLRRLRLVPPPVLRLRPRRVVVLIV